MIFGVISGPIAIYLGARVRREVDESNGDLTGSGKATAAIVLGAIGFVAGAVGVVAVIVGS